MPPRGGGGQSGSVSPFMFGLLIGMTLFSAMSLQWARQELARQQRRHAEMARNQADDMARSMEFAAMTETENTYSDEFNLERAKRFSNYTGGKTRGGQEMIVVARTDEGNTTFGSKDQRIAITSTDDTLLRAKVYRSASAADISRLQESSPDQPIATVDTSGVRQRQVLTSQKSMEGLAEQVYAFYGAHQRFPNPNEFGALRAKFPFLDAWGQPFDYTYISDDAARLEFTTPWNYTQSLKLSLKDDDITAPPAAAVSATSSGGGQQQDKK